VVVVVVEMKEELVVVKVFDGENEKGRRRKGFCIWY